MTTITAAVPVFPLSIFDPVHLGMDENGDQVHVDLAERNMLLGGEPGGGKSNALNLIVAHGALSGDCRLILVDGKQVELGMWRHCADKFIGPSIRTPSPRSPNSSSIMNDRYDKLLAAGLRKITPESGGARLPRRHRRVRLLLRHRRQQAPAGRVRRATRDLVARGRAAGVIVILATQRPSHQVIDPSMRDLFGYRWAFRCTTDSSPTGARPRLGRQGYTAASIDPLARGVSWLLSETGVPRRVKAAYLADHDIKHLAAYAAQLRSRRTCHDRHDRPRLLRTPRRAPGRDADRDQTGVPAS